jgi:hypothetical protein
MTADRISGAAWTPDPGHQKRQAKIDDQEEYRNWSCIPEPAVEFAKACLKPDMTTIEQQAVLRATLDTLTNWFKED